MTLGFKICNSDWTGQGGFKFKVGECFEKNDIPKVGSSGFHFCKQLKDCYDYFDTKGKYVRYALIEAYGQIDNNGTTEYAANKIKIIKELSRKEAEEELIKEVSLCH